MDHFFILKCNKWSYKYLKEFIAKLEFIRKRWVVIMKRWVVKDKLTSELCSTFDSCY